MTDSSPIPPEEFADAVDQLDSAALAGFVGRLEAAAADHATVDVDPPRVTVREDGTQRTIAVVPDGVDASPAAAVDGRIDAVVVATADAAAAIGDSVDADVRTPDDLRRQLLYALSPDAAEAVADEWLGVPARAASYAPAPPEAGAESGGVPEEPSAPEGSSDPDATDEPHGTGPVSDAELSGTVGATLDGGSASPDPPAGGPPEDEETGGSTPADADARRGWSAAQAAVVIAAVAVLLGGVGGVVHAAEASPDGAAGTFADTASVEGEEMSAGELRRRSRAPIDENGAGTSAGETTAPAPGGGGTGMAGEMDIAAATRNVRPSPTCQRSPLHVVQIQMNALKYNNNSTNDGIRTVRRFASPRNRQIVSTFEALVRAINSPAYRPMLSYDSARYTPLGGAGGFSQVQVTIYDDENRTGQYVFRLRKVDEGQYDGCWMTDAVAPTPGTTSRPDGNATHPEGQPTATPD